jgi:hypothetical protein
MRRQHKHAGTLRRLRRSTRPSAGLHGTAPCDAKGGVEWRRTGLGAAGADLEAAADGRTGGSRSALDAEPAVELSTCAGGGQERHLRCLPFHFFLFPLPLLRHPLLCLLLRQP